MHAKAAVLAEEYGLDPDEIVRAAMKLLRPPK